MGAGRPLSLTENWENRIRKMEEQADQVLAVLAERGLGARAIGEVVAEESLPEPGHALEHVVAGAKGVEGGAVMLAGQHPGRTAPEQITIADLTGTGVQDTAIATHALAALAEDAP